MRVLTTIILMLLAFGSSAQLSISAGTSMLKQFQPTKPWGGFHVSLEIPRDDAISLYGRYTHHFKQDTQDPFTPSDYMIYVEPRDPNSGAIGEFIGATPSMNYNIIEGGTRYYLGNGFDYGWAAYGGSNFLLAFNKIKVEYDPYDEAIFQVAEASRLDGSIISLGFGLGGGAKYSTATMGTFYLDLNVAYMIFAQGNKNPLFTEMYNPLIFSLNLGYRKDIVW